MKKAIYIFQKVRKNGTGDIFDDVFGNHDEAVNHAKFIARCDGYSERKKHLYTILTYTFDIPEGDTSTAMDLYKVLLDEDDMRDPSGYEEIEYEDPSGYEEIEDEEEDTEMTYADYFKDHPDENLSWCKPYADSTGRYVAIMHDGKLTDIFTDKTWSAATPDAIRALAKAVNPDYADYSGWDDTHIALEAMQESGCSSCPYFKDCEAMSETFNA